MIKNPLMNVVCEIRFDSNQNDDDFCKFFIKKLKNSGSFKEEFVPQKIMDLPSKIRDASVHLRFAPYYLNEEKFKLFGVGPHVLFFADSGEYSGFDNFLSFVKKGAENLLKCGVDRVVQIRLAYINRIEESIAESTNLFCSINGEKLSQTEDYTFHIEYKMSEKCNVSVRFCNKNAFLPENKDDSFFSVVDFRAEYNVGNDDIYNSLIETHNFIKSIFRKVMKKMYLESKWGLND